MSEIITFFANKYLTIASKRDKKNKKPFKTPILLSYSILILDFSKKFHSRLHEKS